MKEFILILIILSLSFYSLEDEDTSYSMILNQVKIDKVKQIYSHLPKRTSVNILKMCNLMNKEIESNSLNDYEAVYLVYYWIGQNIEVDCTNYNVRYESPVNAFNTGKSSYVGIATLFSTMVSNLGHESNIIEGDLKRIENNNKGEIVAEIAHIWNYVLIDKKYYLFDPTLGAGSCDNKFRKYYSDVFFGTDPNYFVRTHFPSNSTWQLLDTPVEKEKFQSWPYINKFFYLDGFKTVTPDVNNITIHENLEIILTYDKSRDIVVSCNKVVYNGKYIYSDHTYFQLSNGVLKVWFKGNEKMDNFIIYAKPRYDKTSYAVVIYKVNNKQ